MTNKGEGDLANSHFSNFKVMPDLRILNKNQQTWLKCDNQSSWKVARSSIYQSLKMRIGWRIYWTALMKLLEAHFKPNGMWVHSNTPKLVTKSVNHRCCGLTGNCHYPLQESQQL